MNAAHIARYTEPALRGDLNMDGQVDIKDWQDLDTFREIRKSR